MNVQIMVADAPRNKSSGDADTMVGDDPVEKINLTSKEDIKNYINGLM